MRIDFPPTLSTSFQYYFAHLFVSCVFVVSVCVSLVFGWVEQYAPGFTSSIVGKDILTPPDLERIFGLTGGVSVCASNCLTCPQYRMSNC